MKWFLYLAITLAIPVQHAWAQLPVFDPDATYRIPVGDSPTRGPADALITIVEFSDYACPFCRRSQRVMKLLERVYPGQIRMVFKHYPLDPEEGTLPAEAAMAAGDQGRFWAMHDRIFEAGGIVDRAQLESFALELGLDIARFRRVLDDRTYRAHVVRESEYAHKLGVTSAPTFFVNGRPIKGALSLDAFVELIEETLPKARAVRDRGVAPVDVYRTLVADGQQKARVDPTISPRKRPRLDESRTYNVGLGLPGHTLGPDDALLTIVIFSDFQCPFCQRVLPTLRAIRQAYGRDVRFVFRHQPLDFHSLAQLASEAAVAAAAEGRFWEMHELMFRNQKQLSRADLQKYAKAIGLDMERFSSALDDRRYFNVVANERAIGSALGVKGTPTLFINGSPVRGAKPFERIDEHYLAPKLAEARALVARGVARADVYATIMRAAEQPQTAPMTTGKTKTAGVVGPRPPLSAPMESFIANDSDQSLMITCSTRDADQASALYERLSDGESRARVRAYCRPYGVDLPR